jgi:hypothetical protein
MHMSRFVTMSHVTNGGHRSFTSISYSPLHPSLIHQFSKRLVTKREKSMKRRLFGVTNLCHRHGTNPQWSVTPLGGGAQ